MLEDNLYPNDGGYYTPKEPSAQKAKREEEQSKVSAAKPVLEEIIERLNDRIEFYESVRAIPDEVKLDEKKFMHTVAGNAVAAKNLEAERSWIQSRLDNLNE